MPRKSKSTSTAVTVKVQQPKRAAPRRRRARRSRTSRSQALSNSHFANFPGGSILPSASIGFGGSDLRRNAAANPILQAYFKCLQDPFCNPPVKLGMGTLQPTQVYTMYYRTTLISASDGSLAVAVVPIVYGANATSGGNATYPFVYNNNGASSATWGGNNWTNTAAVTNLLDQGRPISVGLRIKPLIAMTATPGLYFSGNLSGTNPNAFVAASVTTVANYPELTPRVGSLGSGVMETGAPEDASSFSFTFPQIQGNSAATSPVFGMPVVVCTGWPASTPFYVEAVYHVEGLAGVSQTIVNNYDDVVSTDNIRDSLGSVLPSWETAMSAYSWWRSSPVAHIARGVLGAAARHMQRRAGFDSNFYSEAMTSGVRVEEVE
jgi:hypothetical protein